jgi:hypothetical protein
MSRDFPDDSSQYGDPEDHRPAQLAPPCDECGESEKMTHPTDRGPLCESCFNEVFSG